MAQIDLSDLALSIVVLGIVASIGATILINIRDTTDCIECTAANGTADYNLSNAAAVGLLEYGNWFNILVIVGVAAVILGLIFLAFRPSGGSGSQTY